MAELGKRERDKLARMEAAFDRMDRTLLDLGRQGLQRLSSQVLTQLLAAEQVAHHAGLVKIERELTGLATQARRYLDRDPLFRSRDWLVGINRTHELVALARDAWGPEVHPDELGAVIGVARRSYVPVPRALSLQALGAAGWVTDSDFVGITVWLYEVETETIFQASSARPVAYFGRDPRRLLYGELSEHHSLTLLDLAHGAWVFDGARASADGRLSLHRELVIEPGPWSGSAAYKGLFAPDWLALVERLAESALVYVEPADVSRVVVDEKHAVARCRMSDRNGAWMVVHVPLAEHNNTVIDNLNRLATEPDLRPDGWFGRAWVERGELRFMPHTALFNDPIQLDLRGRREVHSLHLSLEPARAVQRL